MLRRNFPGQGNNKKMNTHKSLAMLTGADRVERHGRPSGGWVNAHLHAPRRA